MRDIKIEKEMIMGNSRFKFRAWINGKMDYNPISFNTESVNDFFKRFELWREFHIMQYTGQEDKHGVEIYEGDVVTGCYSNFSVDYSEHSAVEFRFAADSDGYQREYTEGWVVGNGSSLCDLDDCEVIGNIHENPELLESEE